MAKRGRDLTEEVPPPPNPGGGPAPHYAHGGRAKKRVRAEGGVAARRLDRPGRRRGGGRLTAAERREMPSSEFALPGHGEGAGGKGSGAYPIDTPGRARSALSRGAHNASPAEDAQIKRRVRAKYPGMKVSGEEED